MEPSQAMSPHEALLQSQLQSTQQQLEELQRQYLEVSLGFTADSLEWLGSIRFCRFWKWRIQPPDPLWKRPCVSHYYLLRYICSEAGSDREWKVQICRDLTTQYYTQITNSETHTHLKTHLKGCPWLSCSWLLTRQELLRQKKSHHLAGRFVNATTDDIKDENTR